MLLWWFPCLAIASNKSQNGCNACSSSSSSNSSSLGIPCSVWIKLQSTKIFGNQISIDDNVICSLIAGDNNVPHIAYSFVSYYQTFTTTVWLKTMQLVLLSTTTTTTISTSTIVTWSIFWQIHNIFAFLAYYYELEISNYIIISWGGKVEKFSHVVSAQKLWARLYFFSLSLTAKSMLYIYFCAQTN